jgi:tRNA (mo5U34)-methyltransferase
MGTGARRDGSAQLSAGEIHAGAEAFRKQLKKVKAGLKLPNGAWYPYDSLSGFGVLDRCLTGERRRLLELAGGAPILDVGCADGDVSFFLESLGFEVDAIDNPPTNYNGMEGVAALRGALGSSVQIFPADLDSQFGLPRRNYGLTFLLGILYHLKNPVYILERLAASSSYCVLSTRVASSSPGGSGDLAALPVAYLLGETEANNDFTNYWIFSEPGLKRLLSRTGWEILDYIAIGAENSEPGRLNADQRVFCLLQSRATRHTGFELTGGWHPVEFGAWRWTERTFGIRLRRERLEGCVLTFRFHLPRPLMERLGGPVTMRASVEGVELPAKAYDHEGEHVYRQRLPGSLRGESCEVTFSLDKALGPTAEDHRELGVLVQFNPDEAPFAVA